MTRFTDSDFEMLMREPPRCAASTTKARELTVMERLASIGLTEGQLFFATHFGEGTLRKIARRAVGRDNPAQYVVGTLLCVRDAWRKKHLQTDIVPTES